MGRFWWGERRHRARGQRQATSSRPAPTPLQRAIQLETLERRRLLAVGVEPFAAPILPEFASSDRIFEHGGSFYFSLENSSNRFDIWETDGTPTGTAPSLQIVSQSPSADSTFYANLNGTLYFGSLGGAAEKGIWKLEDAGWELVTRLHDDGFGPDGFTVINGALWFYQTDSFVFQTGLWKSDGTSAGTNLVWSANSNPFVESGDPVGAQETVYFLSGTQAEGTELWATDGTSQGTHAVADIRAGNGSSSPSQLTEWHGSLVFTANDGVHGDELWITNGTSSGTMLVADIRAGSKGSSLSNLTNVGGVLYFWANDGTHGMELWRSDGTSSGTRLVSDIYPGSASGGTSPLVDLSGTLYFSGNDGVHGSELWRSDGTSSGTQLVADLRLGTGSSSPSDLTSSDGKVYFFANDQVHGSELWGSDGTSAGTMLVFDVVPGSLSSVPRSLAAGNGSLLWRAFDGFGVDQLWKSDGTSAGTVRITDLSSPATVAVSNLIKVNDRYYFVANTSGESVELWASDGVGQGAFRVAGQPASAISFNPSQLTNLNGTLLFVANSIVSGVELWRSNNSGATLVRDIYPGSSSAQVSWLTQVGDTVFFVANDGVAGHELWRSDGTCSGTQLVHDIRPGSLGASPQLLINGGGVLYFSADDGVHGDELWRSDGTSSGTQLVRDLNPGTADSMSSGLPRLAWNGSRVFFSADDGVAGFELWSSDGTCSGTELVRDIRPGIGGASPLNITNLNGTLYFRANDGTTGTELWRSNGTSTGTVLVRDVNPGSAASAPDKLTAVGSLLFFLANDGATGTELWISDGTSSGTRLVNDIRPGTSSSSPSSLVNVNGVLYFAATDGSHGMELWASDGSSDGTYLVYDLRAGSGSSSPSSLTNSDGTLHFVANGSEIGPALWRTTPVGVTADAGEIYRMDEGQPLVLAARGGSNSDRYPATFAWDLNGDGVFGDAEGPNPTVSTSALASLGISGAPHTFYVRVQVSNTVGDVATSAPVPVTIVNAPPSRPALAAGSDSGVYANDRVTNVRQPTFVGTALPNALVTLYRDGVPQAPVVATPSGTYEITIAAPLGDGTYSFTARVTDPYGNLSEPTLPAVVRIDTVAPTHSFIQPTLQWLTEFPQSMNFVFSEVVSGVALTGVGLRFENGANLFTSSQEFTTGDRVTWELEGLNFLPWLPGDYAFSLIAAESGITDLAGNPLANDSLLDFTYAGPSRAPSQLRLIAAEDTGISSTDQQTNVAQPTFAGTAPDGTTVVLYLGEVEVGRGGVSSGSYTVTVDTPLVDGTYNFTARTLNSLGILSSLRGSIPFVLDTIRPEATVVGPGTDPATVPPNDLIVRFNEAAYGVTLAALSLTRNGGPNLLTPTQTIAATSGNLDWKVSKLATLVSAPGLYTLTLTAAGSNITDTAGNPVLADASVSFTYAGASPAPTGLALAPGSDTGTSVTDRLTKFSQPTVVGNTPADTTVVIYEGGVEVGRAPAVGTSFSVTLSTPLSDGARTLTARNINSAGATSSASNSLAITVDATPPVATITHPTPDPRTSTLNTLTISFSEAVYGLTLDSFVFQVDGGPNLLTAAHTLTTTNNLSWTLAGFSSLPWLAGTYVLTYLAAVAGVTDQAGNAPTSDASTSFVYAGRSVAPSTPALAPGQDTGTSSTDRLIRSNTPTFVGTAPPGTTVIVYSGTTAVGSGVAIDGNYNVTVTTPLANGTHTITAKDVNSAGATSLSSGSIVISVDATAPVITLNAPAPSPGPLSDISFSFSERIYGLTLDALSLRVDGGPNLLTSAHQWLNTFNDTYWSLHGESNLPWEPGEYVLAFSSGSVTDQAGNPVADRSIAFSVSLPAALGQPALGPGGDQGISNSDLITNRNTYLQVVGSAPSPVKRVKYYDNGNYLGEVSASGGTYASSSFMLAAGTHSLTVVPSTDGGLLGPASPALTVFVDGIEPTVVIDYEKPDEFTVPLDRVDFIFSEPVYNLTRDSITVKSGSTVIPLTTAQPLTTSDQVTWTLSGLSSLPLEGGFFPVSISIRGSASGNPIDVAGNQLLTPAEVSFYLIRPGQPKLVALGQPNGPLFAIGNQIYFAKYEAATGIELWTSDGTPGGTRLVKDLNAGSANSNPRYFTDVGGVLYFGANGAGSGYNLWRSDGTSSGTVLVKQVDLTALSEKASLARVADPLVNVRGTLYFSADDGATGPELWKSDGTSSGTVLVKDLAPGGTGSSPRYLVEVNGNLFFAANDGATNTGLWKSDGTATGTVRLATFPVQAGSNLHYMANVRGTLFFAADDGVNGYQLWRSNGTSSGTVLVYDVDPVTLIQGYLVDRNFLNAGGMLYFRANDGPGVHALWKSDGTSTGTARVLETPGDPLATFPAVLTNANGTVFFSSLVDIYQVWRSDGTADGTQPVSPGQMFAFDLKAVGGVVYFVGLPLSQADLNNAGIWVSDGTSAGTRMVARFNFDPESNPDFSIPSIMNAAGTLYISIDQGLWSISALAGQAQQVTLTNQPAANIALGAPFALSIAIRDGYGDIVANYNSTATISLASNPGGATLGGALTVPVVNGVATFSGLSLNQLGNNYSLRVTSGSLPPTTISNVFNVLAQVNEPEIAILGLAGAPPNQTETPILDESQTISTVNGTDFGSPTAGAAVTIHYLVRNSGNAVLELSDSVRIAGANPDDFQLTLAPASQIPPGGSSEFRIRFAPTAAGLRSAEIRIANNDGDEGPYNFLIQGTGSAALTLAEIDVQGSGVSIGSSDGSPAVVDGTDWGDVALGQAVTHTFTILNLGTSTLLLPASPMIGISGAGASDFTVVTTPTVPTILSGGSASFSIRFQPTVGGLRVATVSIANSDSNENPYSFAISGGMPLLVGDANGDGVVGAADYASWAAQFGLTGLGWSADFDRNGSVGAGDYALWAGNFGRSLGGAALTAPAAALAILGSNAAPAGALSDQPVRTATLSQRFERAWSGARATDQVLDQVQTWQPAVPVEDALAPTRSNGTTSLWDRVLGKVADSSSRTSG